jgi:hypothetical protein
MSTSNYISSENPFSFEKDHKKVYNIILYVFIKISL